MRKNELSSFVCGVSEKRERCSISLDLFFSFEIERRETRKMLGCCIPRDSSKQTNKMINEALERDRKEMNAESKLLLLGK